MCTVPNTKPLSEKINVQKKNIKKFKTNQKSSKKKIRSDFHVCVLFLPRTILATELFLQQTAVT